VGSENDPFAVRRDGRGEVVVGAAGELCPFAGVQVDAPEVEVVASRSAVGRIDNAGTVRDENRLALDARLGSSDLLEVTALIQAPEIDASAAGRRQNEIAVFCPSEGGDVLGLRCDALGRVQLGSARGPNGRRMFGADRSQQCAVWSCAKAVEAQHSRWNFVKAAGTGGELFEAHLFRSLRQSGENEHRTIDPDRGAQFS